MEKLIHKSSVLLLLSSSIFLMACEKLPVNFGLRVEDSLGNVIDCNDQQGGFGIEVPYFVETDQVVSLKYKGEGSAKWSLRVDDQIINLEGTNVSLKFPDSGVVSGSLQATSICNTDELHDFQLKVVEKLGRPSLVINNGESYTKSQQVSLSHSASGATAILLSNKPNCSDGQWRDYDSSSKANIYVANANNSYYVKFKNQVRESKCVGASIVHDNVAPVVQLSGMPAKLSNVKDISFRASARDNLSGVEHLLCSLDGEAYVACKDAVLRKNLSEGAHRLQLYASDKAGNVSNLFAYDFQLDHTAPSIVLSKVPQVFNAGGKQEYGFSWDGNLEKGDRIICNTGEGFKPCDTTVSINATEEAEYSIVAYAVDAVGNESSRLLHSFTVDKSGPKTTLTKKPLNPSVSGEASFGFSSVDKGIGNYTQYCSLNGSRFDVCSSEIKYQNLANQFHTFKVYAVDSLGNKGNEVTYTWEVDDGIVSEEYLVGEAVKNVDIVVVIDNSSSMEKEQKEMGKRFGDFISSLSGLNWRLGIITTNAEDNNQYAGGRLLDFNRKTPNLDPQFVISSEDNEPEKLFKNSIRVTEGGNDTEEGIYALRKFLDREDSQMLRDEAHFASIIISDEDEKSRGRNLRSHNKPENLVEAIRSKYKGKKIYSNHSIIYKPGDDKCGRKGGKYEGFTYNALSEMTDGIVGSICEPNYTNQLLSIGDRIQETAFSVALKCIPRDTDGDGKPDIKVRYFPEPKDPIQEKLRKDKLVLVPYPEKGTKLHLVYRCDK
jgi:hypothetical protein